MMTNNECSRLDSVVLRVLLCFSLAAQGNATRAPEPLTGPLPTSIVVTATKTALLEAGDNAQLTVIANISNGTTQNITSASTGTTYESTNPTVATVNASGLVRSVSKGTAVIFATNGGRTASVTITVQSLLTPECIVNILNRQVQVGADGTFALGNVPVPPGAFRARVICERPGKTDVGASPFILGVPNGDTAFGPITFGAANPIPVALTITSPATILTPSAPGAQLVTTGRLVDNTNVDITLNNTGTTYLISNPNIATVSKDGFVSAKLSG